MNAVGIRTCLGCRVRKHKRELCRFAVDGRGMLVFDEGMRLEGRGAYCCCNKQCLQGMLRNRRGLTKTLRCGELQWDVALMENSRLENRPHSSSLSR